jgi:hypothetical protein
MDVGNMKILGTSGLEMKHEIRNSGGTLQSRLAFLIDERITVQRQVITGRTIYRR